jgi:integrase/recombinase XerD
MFGLKKLRIMDDIRMKRHGTGRKVKKNTLVAHIAPVQDLLPVDRRESLEAWFNLYLTVEERLGSNTYKAKDHDLRVFLKHFEDVSHSGNPNHWTPSVTKGFQKALGRGENRRKPSTINRTLATLRHCSSWIGRHRPFLAGDPCKGVADLRMDEPSWKGLTDMEVTRLRSAGEQLLKLKTGKKQQAIRDYAIFLVLLHTGLRVSELLALDRDQYEGKHFRQVQRKGNKVSSQVFLPKEPREALDRYLDETMERTAGPLFVSKTGERLQRQNVDDALKSLANQANAQMKSKDQRISLSAHILRHTMLRKVAEKFGVQHAMETAGHTSSNYIWRYIKPSQDEKEKALEDLF